MFWNDRWLWLHNLVNMLKKIHWIVHVNLVNFMFYAFYLNLFLNWEKRQKEKKRGLDKNVEQELGLSVHRPSSRIMFLVYKRTIWNTKTSKWSYQNILRKKPQMCDLASHVLLEGHIKEQSLAADLSHSVLSKSWWTCGILPNLYNPCNGIWGLWSLLMKKSQILMLLSCGHSWLGKG